MKIRRYTCKDMQEALVKVKMDLGSEAVIMNSRKVKQKGLAGLFAKPMVEVVAAIDDDYFRPRPASKEQKMVIPEYKAAPKTYESKTAESPNLEENRKIIDLQNKVKSMEDMMKEIYRAVQGKKDPEMNQPQETPTIVTPIPKSILTQVSKQIPIQAPTQSTSPVPDCEGISTLRKVLFEHDVEPKLIEKIVEKITERGGQNLKQEEVFGLAERVMTVLLGEPEPIILKDEKRPHIAIFIGPTGVGKTTTLAKIAADFTLNRQKKVALITADTYRIAAVEQLRTYAEILNLPVTVVYSPTEVKEAVARLSDNDIILIDTAGRSHKNKTHFDELKTLVSAVSADETFLVMSCNTSRIAIREILEYYAFIRNYKLLFTKLDEATVPGVILNARYMTGKSLSYTTAGQSVPDDLDIANVKQLAMSILGKGSM